MTPPIHVGLAQHPLIKRAGGAVSHTREQVTKIDLQACDCGMRLG